MSEPEGTPVAIRKLLKLAERTGSELDQCAKIVPALRQIARIGTR